jgi:hypothetical protein
MNTRAAYLVSSVTCDCGLPPRNALRWPNSVSSLATAEESRSDMAILTAGAYLTTPNEPPRARCSAWWRVADRARRRLFWTRFCPMARKRRPNPRAAPQADRARHRASKACGDARSIPQFC